MKKITLFLAFLLTSFVWQTNAQTLNQPANWPNTNWTLDVIEHSGSNPQDIEADPTIDANFAYDDDDTGSGSHDVIAAESPVIDLTAAHNAGEDFIIVSGDYVFNNIDNDEYLAIEYFDADAGAWVLLYQFDNTDTPSAPTDNFCSGTHVSYSTTPFEISGFTATQLAGFKYRLIYNDDITGGNGYNWGFCFGSPTLVSSNLVDPVATLTLDPDCSNSQFNVNVNVTDLGGASSVTIADDQGSASQQLSAPGMVTFGPYASGTTVNFTITNNDNSNFSADQSISYTCPVNNNNDDCYNADALTVYPAGAGAGNETAVDPANYTDSGSHPSCDNAGTNIDMWFTVTVPAGQTGFKAIYSGNAAAQVESALWDSCGGSDLACYNQTSNAYQVFDGLTSGQTYYLQLWLDDFNADTFSVVLEELPPAPNCAENPVPADGATGVAVQSGRSVVLSWDAPSSGPAPDSYKLELGTTSGTYPVSGVVSGTSINLINVSENTTYYWKVTPINGGTEASGCAEWSFTTGAYPAPPANDTCSGAIALNVDADACVTPTLTDNSFATDSGEAAPSCATYSGGDLWFTVTVPASGAISVATSEEAGSNLTDTGMAVYSGTCGSLTEVDCNDDGGPGTFSQIDLTGQTPGDVLYVRVWEYNNDSFGAFNICAWDPDASALSENSIEGFKFYPNPVNHTLNLSAKDKIDMISISNVTGQEVLSLKPNATQTQVDMSHLQNGVYFVKAQVNGQLTAFKVVKK